MADTAALQENKRHGDRWFPFDIYPCTIPKDFPQVALHWQNSMELIFVKKGSGLVQVGLEPVTARAGDIFVLAPGMLHGLGQLPGETMEYENIIFEVELLGGSSDLCYRRYLLPLQSGVGSVANAVLYGLTDSGFRHLNVYSEVLQDAVLELMEKGVVDYASATALALSQEGKERFRKNFSCSSRSTPINFDSQKK